MKTRIILLGIGCLLWFGGSVSAAPLLDSTAGTFTDNYANNAGIPTRSGANVNTVTGKLQLTNNANGYTAPFRASGYVVTQSISPLSVAKWGSLNLDAAIPEGTNVKVQVNDCDPLPYDDVYLPGNSQGISAFPINLENVPVLTTSPDAQTAKPQCLKFKITLATENATSTPEIDSLSFNWTTLQGDTVTSSLAIGSWVEESGTDQKGDYQSPYRNSSVYPAFRWVSDDKQKDQWVDEIFVLDEKIVTWSSWAGSNMFALNRNTGSELWNLPFQRNSGPRAAITENGILYGTDIGSDLFYTIDINTGQINWTYNFSGGHGNSQAVVGNDGVIYTVRNTTSNPSTQSIYAFNPDGTIKFRKDYTINYTTSGGKMVVGDNGNLFFYYTTDAASNAGKLLSINPANGETLWSYDAGNLSVLMMGDDGTIYAGSGIFYSSDKPVKILAINQDGSLKWERNFGNNRGFNYLVAKDDGALWASFTGTSYSDTHLFELSTVDGSTIWSEAGSKTLQFSDSQGGLYFTSSNWVDPIGTAKLNFMDANHNSKWTVSYDYDGTWGWYSYDVARLDERGWLYSGWGKTVQDEEYNYVPDQQWAKLFAMSPWTLSGAADVETVKDGGVLNFTITTAMRQTNPLFGEVNKIQVVMDNDDKVPLTYSYTNGTGDTVWIGSYTIPAGTSSGTHSYIIEAAQSHLQTDMATHFAAAPEQSNNTGIILAGNFTVDNDVPAISAVASSCSSTSCVINWSTDEAASSRIEYGKTSSYGDTTSESDTIVRLTSHSITLSDLSPCATYHYRVKSKDEATNEGVGEDKTFTTSGCSIGGQFSGPAKPNYAPGTISNGVTMSREEIQAKIDEIKKLLAQLIGQLIEELQKQLVAQ